MTWEPELDEIRRREELARRMGGEDNIKRQHDSGRFTVRERIEKLLDAGTFHERGSLSGRATYDGVELTEFRPANFVMGHGRIDGRPVVVGGDDFTVRGGAGDAGMIIKQIQAERMAREWRMPMIRLVDGTGGGGSVRMLDQMKRTYLPGMPGWDESTAAMSEIPIVGAALGPVAGLGAVRAVAAHFSVMVKGLSQVFVAGPPVVARALPESPDKEELGGSHIHTRNGTIDNEAESEDDALDQVRRFLSYLPSSVWEGPPRGPVADDPERRDEELLSIIPRERRRVYDARRLVRHVVDDGSVFEIGRWWGRSIVTCFARLDGWPVGIMAGDPGYIGGSLTADTAEKMVRFIDLCDTFRVPVVHLLDQPGFLIGTAGEKASTIRKGVRLMAAVNQADVPWVTVITRKAFGVAGASHGPEGRLNSRFAWPSADWGSLPLEGGIEAAYRRELEAADDPEAFLADITARMNAIRSPLRSAEAFNIEEMIDPRDTRPILCGWAERAHHLVAQDLRPRARGLRP